MKVVSIVNYKGGVGKTTVTANLGAELASRGWRVLLIDADPQCSLTFSFIAEEWGDLAQQERTLKNLFDQALDQDSPKIPFRDLICTPTKVNSKIDGKLNLIASHLALIDIDLELACTLNAATPKQRIQNFLNCYGRIAKELNLLQKNYDFCLIDCPPNFNIVTKTMIAGSDYILVPSRPDHLSTLGIKYLDSSVEAFVEDYNSNAKRSNGKYSLIDPKIIGVIFTMVKMRGEQPIYDQQKYINDVIKNTKLPIFENYIREYSSLFASASENSVPVVLKSSSINVVSELQLFVDEIESTIT